MTEQTKNKKQLKAERAAQKAEQASRQAFIHLNAKRNKRGEFDSTGA